ncbi:hypothetical protein TNIN_464931 [Trichonephila inaurata madagascariensis]|uniref:Serine/threonine-protein phosphatase 4 regulatory subunit 1 n=1 Tax=Trichonephila inaurata madagascariensis TaxID=2747483 RepID=A0A8X7C9X8_9ARAC|nr:hypothetical protein TNIN_464931 [Trichonephila inaurata madagascariensis]
MSCCVSKEIRCKELSSLFMSLLQDGSKWVRLGAYQALGAFISTFAEPDRTGLYYDKDGNLTVVDVSKTLVLSSSQEEPNSKNEVLCNGKIEDSSNLSSDDSDSSLDRTNSSTSCDSVVPECNNGTNSSASDVPGVLCHVGNNQTVIEASTSTMTTGGDRSLAAENETNDSSNGSSNCDSMQLTNDLNSGDNWTSFDSSDNKIVQNGEFCHRSEEVATLQKYLRVANLGNHFDDENLTEEEKEFKKLWFEAMHSCDEAINGVLSYREMNGTIAMPVDLDQDLIQRMKPDDKSALLNSIVESQELSISSSAAFSGSTNNEAIPLISCCNSIRENSIIESQELNTSSSATFSDSNNCEAAQITNFYNSIRENNKNSSLENSNDIEALSSCVQHSTGDLNDTGNDSISNNMRNLSLNAQELNYTSNELSVDKNLEESVELKTKNESAFNYFQYWREPLPEIDIDTAVDCLNDSPDEQLSNNYFVCDASNNRKNMGGKKWVWYMEDYSSDSFMLHDMCRSNNEASENKGEPPPAELTPHDQDIVPPELLSCFVKMTDGSNSATDAEIVNLPRFPASFVMMWKVRRTLAFSMHQLAVILGPEITSKDLLPVFSRLISDLDEVRIGILQNLCEFLRVLKPEERKQFLPSLPKFLVSVNDHDSNIRNWRFRLILAEQLVLIASLYEPQDVRDHLVPLSFTLIRDKICEVRLVAVRVVAAIMERLSDHPTPIYTKAVLSELTEKFVHSPRWLHRQLYVYICQQIVLEKALSPDQFAEDALPQLLYLCWDRVPNVRIAIARCLVIVIWPMEVFSDPKSPHRELLLQTIHTLQSDMDADVRYYANMVSTHECSCLQNGEFTNVVEPFV